MLKHLLNGTSYSAFALRAPNDGTGASDDGAQDDNQQQQSGGAGDAADGGQGADDQQQVSGEGDGGDGAASDGQQRAADAGGADDEGGEPPRPDWKTRELSRKHRQIQERNGRITDLEQRLADAQALAERLAAGNQQQQNGEGDPLVQRVVARPVATDGDPVETRAQEIAAKRQFDADCNAANEKGKKEFGAKWDQAAANIAQLGGFDVTTMVGIMATDDPAKVLYELGNNPDEFHRVMDMSPLRRQTEFVKIAVKPKKAPVQRSRAAPPVDPIRGRSNNDPGELRDDQDDDTWFQRRRAAKQKKWTDQNARH